MTTVMTTDLAEYNKRIERLAELMGGDLIATRAAVALGRSGYTLPEHIAAATHEELVNVKGVGLGSALRIGELRGSLRPGGRGRVDMTSRLLNEVYEHLSALVKQHDHQVVSCAALGAHRGLPPEIEATIEHFGRRYTLVLTPSEINHWEQTELTP